MRTLTPILAVGLLIGHLAFAKTPKNDSWERSGNPEEIQIALAERLIAADRVGAGLSIIADLKRAGSTAPELDLIQGVGLVLSGQPTEAMRILEDYQERVSDDHRSHTALGLLYADHDRVDDAIIELKLSIDLEPYDAAVHNNLGFLQMSLNRHDAAHESLETAATLDSTQPKYRTNMAYNLVALERHDDALNAFLSVATTANAHAQFALALELNGNTPLAIDHYKAALQSEPSNDAASSALNRLTSTSSE